MLRHRYGSPTAFAVSCLGKEKNKIVKIFGFSLSMSIVLSKRLKAYGVQPFNLYFSLYFESLPSIPVPKKIAYHNAMGISQGRIVKS